MNRKSVLIPTTTSPADGDVLTYDSADGYYRPKTPSGGNPVVISPTSLSANQNNYSPTSWGSVGILRQDASADVTITGFSSTVTVNVVTFINISSSYIITLAHQSTSSSVGNRINISGGSNLLLGPSDSVTLFYDSVSGFWRSI